MNGTETHPVLRTEIIEIGDHEVHLFKTDISCVEIVPIYFCAEPPVLDKEIRYYPGNVWEMCSPKEEEQLFEATLRLARSDRHWPSDVKEAKVAWKEAGGIGLIPDYDSIEREE